MGQKTNPNIIRLGKQNNWNYKYFEKKYNELPIYTFKNLEIENFIIRFLKLNGLTVHKIKFYHIENTLHIFISYFLSLKTILVINSSYKTKKLKLVKEQKKIKRKFLKNRIKIKKNIKKQIKYEKLNYKINLIKNVKNNFLNETKTIVIQDKQKSKIKRVKLLKNYKKKLVAKNYKNISKIKKNSFLEKLFEGIILFINKQTNISLTLKQLNKNTKQEISKKKFQFIKKNLVKLRKYKQNQFFTEGVNVVFNCITNTNSAILLSKFIATELKKLKRHNFFLKFIKTTLTLFSNKTFSKCKGIKIKVKGRFNGAPRAKDKIIYIKNGVPTLTLNSKIDYGETTSFSPNGTFGVKVWINEKY